MIQKSDIKFLIVHCSDTPDEQNLQAIDIHKMHLSFGWEGVGYHKIICRNGNVENGRPEYWVGAHTYGKNKTSLGVCLIGRDIFLNEQLISLKKLLVEWKYKYPNSIILGHRDAIKTKKTCPNFNVDEWCKKEKIF